MTLISLAKYVNLRGLDSDSSEHEYFCWRWSQTHFREQMQEDAQKVPDDGEYLAELLEPVR
jgi:hypothetical protein